MSKPKYSREDLGNYKLRVTDAVSIISLHPDWGYSKANAELKAKHGKGLRKATFLEIKRDVLKLPKRTRVVPYKLPKAARKPPKETVYAKAARSIFKPNNWKWVASGWSKIVKTGFRVFERTYGFTLIDDVLVKMATDDLRTFLKWLAGRFPRSVFSLQISYVVGSRDVNTRAKAINQYKKKTDMVRGWGIETHQIELYEDVVERFREKLNNLAMRPYPVWLVATQIVNHDVTV